MKFENTQVFNFKGAFRGMRNPYESWNASDSFFGLVNLYNADPLTDVCDAWIEYENVGRRERGAEEYSHEMENYNEYYNILEEYEHWLVNEGILNSANEYDDIYEVAFLGPNDLDLAQRLILAGDEQAKFMRQIFVSVDITAPIYFFKEFDTYKISTTSNSTSTMHKLATTPITIDCFETDDFNDEWLKSTGIEPQCDTWINDNIIYFLESLRLKYLEIKDKRYWKELIRWLPESWLQMRTWTANYAVLRNMYFQRRNHKLTEWHQFCDWIKSLPYGEELITIE